MKMTGEQRIAASRQRVWEGLNDPAVLRQCIPGCQSLEREPDGRLRATVEVKIGPIGARFTGAVTLSDIDAANGYRITGEGQGGTVGHARGGARVKLADDGAGTLLSYDVDAEVGGRLAQLGGPLIDATAKQLAAKFFKTFDTVVCGAGAAPAAETTSGSGADATIAATLPTQPSLIPPATQTVVGTLPAPPTYPWGLVVALVVAVLAGFLMGRTAIADWWMVAVAVLVILAASAGFQAGRGGRQ
jgi:carbon monoxide dehydrogenase subunit G